MFHAAAAPATHFSVLKAAQVSYVMRRFDLEQFFANIEKHKITDLVVVPPMAIGLIMSPLNKKYSLKKVKTGVSGAAPLDKGPQARLKALLSDDAPVTQVWGMTELSCVATMFPYPESDTTGSVGRLLPNLEAKYLSPLTPFLENHTHITYHQINRRQRQQHLRLQQRRRTLHTRPHRNKGLL
jgi:4-coumarate--CoA ligase